MRKLIEKLEKMPAIDPRGYTNAEYRSTLNQLLREMHNRIEALEKEKREQDERVSEIANWFTP